MWTLVRTSVIQLWLTYDAVDKTLYINSKIGDFISFISTESGFGNIELRSGKPFVKVVSGHIEVDRFVVSGKVVE